MKFRWQADNGPLILVLDPFSPHELIKKHKIKIKKQQQNQKIVVIVGHTLKTLFGSMHGKPYVVTLF